MPITTLDLSGSSIGDEGCASLAEALKTNSTITDLYLNDNDISDDLLAKIEDALKPNRTLKVTSILISLSLLLSLSLI